MKSIEFNLTVSFNSVAPGMVGDVNAKTIVKISDQNITTRDALVIINAIEDSVKQILKMHPDLTDLYLRSKGIDSGRMM